jgi:glycosyltransferase involved in cell wall biosynthesis
MDRNFKKISIITPSLNRVDMLEGVIQNVLMQNYPDFEHIVIDGGSTDGTRDMVEKYPHVHFEYGSDQGMYDALNKGLEVASGEIIGFLNTDDYYAEGIFLEVASKFDDESIMAVAGCATVFHEPAEGGMEIVGRYSPNEKSLLECSTIGSNYFNAWFFRKALFERVGRFDVNYRIAGDKDLMLRIALDDVHYVTIEKLVYRYRQHPGSLTFHDTDQRRERSAREQLNMAAHYLSGAKLTRLQRKLLVELRSRETADMAMRSLKAREFGRSFHYCIEGIKYDLLWPFKIAWFVMKLGIKNGIGFARKTVNRVADQS